MTLNKEADRTLLHSDLIFTTRVKLIVFSSIIWFTNRYRLQVFTYSSMWCIYSVFHDLHVCVNKSFKVYLQILHQGSPFYILKKQKLKTSSVIVYVLIYQKQDSYNQGKKKKILHKYLNHFSWGINQ